MVSILLFVVYVILWAILLWLWNTSNQAKDEKKYAPSPGWAVPVLGHLPHLLRLGSHPVLTLEHLTQKLGPAVTLRMGNAHCLLLSSQQGIREVLHHQAYRFLDRPSSKRLSTLFANDADNSLAFCKWSEVHERRRWITRRRCSSSTYLILALEAESETLIDHLQSLATQGPFDPKWALHKACAGVFTRFLCASSFQWTDPHFEKMVTTFDSVFYSINQLHPIDIFPWLSPLYSQYLQDLLDKAAEVRSFIQHHIIQPRLKGAHIGDLTGALLDEMEAGFFTQEQTLFTLEDLLGGHSAVGNLLLRLLGEVAMHSDVQARIQAELDALSPHKLVLANRHKLPYLTAAIWETLRRTASPLVPHVATDDATVLGYHVEKGTVVLLHNWGLCRSPELWSHPESFYPDHFIKDEKVVRPDHFLPFGGGPRACLGSRILLDSVLSLSAAILLHFNIRIENPDMINWPLASIALPATTFPFHFTPRCHP